jgi:two-component system sensor histidine kinase FlrB
VRFLPWLWAGILPSSSAMEILAASASSASPVSAASGTTSMGGAGEVSPGEAQRLAEAFRIFSQASEELTSAYSELQGQVSRLTQELAVANGKLRQQFQEKAALTERLSLLLAALPAGVVVLGADGRVLTSNPAADELLGNTLDRSWADVEEELLQATDTPGEHLCGERRLAIAVTPLDSAGGRIVLVHDITEAQQLKTQAARNHRLAAMGEMAAQLAHQLRTPLAAALLYAGNLENPDLPATTRVSIAEKTVARLKHLERLIQDMLLFARGEVLGRESFAVSDLLGELAQTFEPLAQNCGIRFVVADASEGAVVIGNRKALTGALTNLLENALQAVDVDGAARITLAADPGIEAVAIRVIDNGRGMDATTAARLFEPFFTTRPEGTGLGLAIARGVARAHGGSIEVHSQPGTGAEFLLTLPCQTH